MSTVHTLCVPLVAWVFCCGGAAGAGSPDRYDVTWDSPSADANGSMPLGNGDVGLNAWIEPSGDLLFYISKTDAWGDNARLLKVGRVRVAVDPPLPTDAFRQTLRLREGTLEAKFGKGDDATSIHLWVDANHPAIHVTIDGSTPCTATASMELWRTERFELPSIEVSDVQLDRSKPTKQHAPTIVEPDTVLTNLPDRIGWYHHNVKSVGPAQHAKTQGVTGYERPDPLLHRTFGGVMAAEGGRRLDDNHLQSPRSNTHRFSIFVRTVHPSSPQQWLAVMEQTIAEVEKRSFEDRRGAHEQWWADFWQRSWIDVTPGGNAAAVSLIPANKHAVKIGVDQSGRSRFGGQFGRFSMFDATLSEIEIKKNVSTTVGDDAFVVSRAYALQRFIDACAGRGRYPIKFNGSIFTVPYANKPGDADYRRWGPGYWWVCTNPMPELAGLHALTARLLALPERLTTPEQRTFWTALKAKLPPLPTRKVGEALALAPAEKFASKRNVENPELYAVFPFRLVSFERENADLGVRALEHRWARGNFGWRQDDIFMAYLGLAEDARKNLVGRARNHHRGSRFPAFWGPNYDWIPDQDHGGVLMKTLQTMLLQPDPYSDKLYLLPAWPKDWDVTFKLHAPRQTTIECEFRDGKIHFLNVTPSERREDVVMSTNES